jgi:hypothetical protein
MIGIRYNSRGFIPSSSSPLFSSIPKSALEINFILCYSKRFFPRSLSARFSCAFRTPVFRCVSRSYTCWLISMCVRRTYLVGRYASIGIFTANYRQNDDKIADLWPCPTRPNLPLYLFCVALSRPSAHLRVRRAWDGMDNALYQAKQHRRMKATNVTI